MFGCSRPPSLSLLFFFLFTKSVYGYHGFSTADRYHYMEVLSPTDIAYVYKMRSAEDFGVTFSNTYRELNLVLGQPYNGCKALTNKCMVEGAIVLLEKGECTFVTKSTNAENAGAIAVIIADDNYENSEEYIIMIRDFSNRIVNIPALFLRGKDGWKISAYLDPFKPAIVNIPINITRIPLERMHFPPWTVW